MKTRLDRVRERMAAAGLSQLLITDPSSIRYLTGLSVQPGERFFGLLVTKNREPFLFLNRLFPSDTELPVIWLRDTDDAPALVAARLLPGEALGVDKLLPARFLLPLMDKGISARLGSDCVDWVRAVKDGEEQDRMRRSSAVNDAVMERVTALLREGMTEREAADFVLRCYREAGCEDVSFPPIVSFGPNAADPHHEPDDTVLRRGHCVILDIGGVKDGYCSDMTRTWFCREASPRHRALHELAVRANEAAEAMIRPGVPLRDIDRAAREVIAAAGYGPNFTHRLGHFIGQEVHEYGDVSEAFTREVEPGMCFSIEPGIYLSGEFGVRIEDLVLVTPSGCEVLNKVDKSWKLIG